MTEQGYPPPRQPGRARAPQESRNNGWQMLGAFDSGSDVESDVPPWAIPGGIEPVRPTRRPTSTVEAEPVVEPELEPEPEVGGRRPGRSRAAATRRRRSRRRLTTWGSVLVVAGLVAVAVYYLNQPGTAPRSYVTTLQKGEFSSVPDACKVVAPASLSTYLNGTASTSVQTSNAAVKSACTFTVDHRPTFRVLDISVEAYTPSLIAPGDGSATSYAKYIFGQTKQVYAKPPKQSQQPAAVISPLGGLGSQAFSAVQVYRINSKTDRVTVLARVHNVVVTVSLWANAGSGFGPVSISQLQAAALGAARTTVAAVSAQHAVGA